MLISRDEIEKSISNYGWKWVDNTITKSFVFNSYMESISFVNTVAEISERMNHHSDLHISYCKIKVSISSHDLGGVSTKCINLATQIDQINAI